MMNFFVQREFEEDWLRQRAKALATGRGHPNENGKFWQILSEPKHLIFGISHQASSPILVLHQLIDDISYPVPDWDFLSKREDFWADNRARDLFLGANLR